MEPRQVCLEFGEAPSSQQLRHRGTHLAAVVAVARTAAAAAAGGLGGAVTAQVALLAAAVAAAAAGGTGAAALLEATALATALALLLLGALCTTAALAADLHRRSLRSWFGSKDRRFTRGGRSGGLGLGRQGIILALHAPESGLGVISF